jgi:hypothetical protein
MSGDWNGADQLEASVAVGLLDTSVGANERIEA